MSNRMERRDFLRLFGLIALGAGLSACGNPFGQGDPFVGSSVEIMPWKDKETALHLALRMWTAGEMIKPYAPAVPKTIEEARELAAEIWPYYYLNGINENPIDIKSINIRQFDADENFYLLGESYCRRDNDIYLNARFVNKWSPWYGKPQIIATLAHEIGHTYAKICNYDDTVEAAAQLASMEVLAAMVRDGNKVALLPFLADVNQLAEGYYLYSCINDRTMYDYRNRYVAQLPNSAYQLAAYDKIYLVWKVDNFKNHKEFLEDYTVTPYLMLCHAAASNDHLTPKLPSVHNKTQQIDMSDTLYVLSHLSPLLDGYKLLRYQGPKGTT